MSGEASKTDKATKSIIAYVSFINIAVDFIIEPVSTFISGYSQTLGESSRQINSIITNVLVFAPLIAVAVVLGAVVGGESLSNISGVPSVDIQLLVTITLGIAGIVAFYVSYISLERSFKESVYVSMLLFAGSYGVSIFNTPEVYASIAVVLYGLGGYVTERIETYNPYPDEHIKENLDTIKKTVVIASGLGLILIPSVYYAFTNFQQMSETFSTASILSIAGVSYLIPELQKPYIENLYGHTELKTNSQMWLLTPKLAILASLFISLFKSSLSVYAVLGVLSPIVTTILFVVYMKLQTKDSILGDFYLDSEMYADPLFVGPNEEIGFEGTVSNEDNDKRTMSMETTVRLEIPESMPDTTRPWRRVALSCHGIYKTLSYAESSDKDVQDFMEFYDDVCLVTYTELVESDNSVPWSNWPEELSNRTLSNMHRASNVDLQNVNDAEISASDNKRDSSMYAE